MTRGYFPWDACNTVSLQLEAWCARYTTVEDAAGISAGALAMVLTDAMTGAKTPTGPYRRLYKVAEHQLRWESRISGRDVPFGIWRSIPDPGEALLCEFTRAYACVYMGTELAPLDLREQRVLTRSVASRRHALEGHWLMADVGEDYAQVVTVLNRVNTAWESHAHGPSNCCVEFSQLWNHEHNKAHTWYERWRHDLKGGTRGPNQQADSPRHYGPPYAESVLGQHGRGRAGAGQPDVWPAAQYPTEQHGQF